MKLKEKVVSGFVWHSVERFGWLAVQSLISLLLARKLLPGDFGLVSMLMVFSAVAQGIVESGFSQALIRKQDATERDYTSVFYVNIVVAIVLYLILCGLAGPIARFYDQPTLTRHAPTLFAIIPIGALTLVHNTIILKQMRFKASAVINLSATISTGVVAVWMAYRGMGIQSLVFQMVGREALRMALLWTWNRWLPTGGFSLSAVRELFGFGSKLMVTGILGNVAGNIAQFLIGKFRSPLELGLYYQSQKLRDSFSLSITAAITNVSFPAFAELQDKPQELREASRKVIVVLSFALFPVLLGLAGIAEDFFRLVLTEKWLDAVPYFQVFCLAALFLPGTFVSYNILRAKGCGTQILRVEFIKRVVMLAMILATVFVSVMAVVWAMLAYSAFELVIHLLYARRHSGYSLGKFLRDSAPYLAISLAMYGLIWAVGQLAPQIIGLAQGSIGLLVLKIAVGASFYLLMSSLLRTEAWWEARTIISGLRTKFRPQKPTADKID
ncbi:MAG: lipopolysaccharide biosynthesis protein [Rikenellaceae bacterium]|nr:lipopolysaccharide biosynthesis protein [Rikenellaceae bacterium]